MDPALAGWCGKATGVPLAAPFGPDVDDAGRLSAGGAASEGMLVAPVALTAGRPLDGWPQRAGVEKLHDTLMMSLPWTTRLSVDFFRSRVSIWSVFRP